MKNFAGADLFKVLIMVMVLCSSAVFAADWVQVVPVADGFDLLKNAGCGNERFAQIGNHMVIHSGEIFNDSAIKKSPLSTTPVRPSEKLYLITTKDPAIFNATFPGARIVYKEMGFIVLLAGETAAMNLMSKQSDFTKVELLPENQVLLSAPVTCDKAVKKTDDPIGKFLTPLDMPAFMADLTDLVAFKTRSSYVSAAQSSINHCENIFKQMGYATAQIPFNIGSTQTNNLVAEIQGSNEEKYGQILVVGHLDSTSPVAKTNAPGADDNGSGAAGVIALARLLKTSGLQPAATIKFVLFMGEEQGLYGSKAYSRALTPDGRKKIRAVLNLDMIGFDADEPLSVMIETGAFNRPMVEKMQELAKNYSSFIIQTSFNPYGSDHAPFINLQIPAVLTIESEFATNPNYHKVTDLMDSINPALCENILRLNAAMLYVYGIMPATK